MYDIAVVGAGPAGSYAAYLLAREGFHVLLLEEHSAPGERIICSGIIGSEAVDEMPLPRSSILGTLQNALFISPGCKEFSFRPDENLAYIVSRRTFDSEIARMAQSLGAVLKVNARAEKLAVESDGVKIDVKISGEIVSFRARLCILATGFGSALLSRAGFKETLATVQAAQVELDIGALTDTEIYLGGEVAPGGFGWAVPLGEGRARVGITTDQRASLYLQKLLQHPKMKNRLNGSAFRIQSCPIPIGTLTNCVLDRLVVVGEAAGQVKTTTNGGIYYGMICAEMAAEVIIEALRANDLQRSRLLPYHQRWRDRLQSELRLGLVLREFFGRLSDSQIDLLFDLTRMDSIVYLIRKMARFDWHGPLIQAVLGQGFFRSVLRATLGGPLLPEARDVKP